MNKGIILGTVILVAVLVTSTAIQIPKAQTTTRLFVEPEIIDPALVRGNTFTINCSVADVMDLYLWQIKLFFDPTILNCTGAWYPPDHIFASKDGMPITPVMNNTMGYVFQGYSLLAGVSGATGSGVLCQMSFEVIDYGRSWLNYSEPYGEDTSLLDSNLQLISTEVINGYFSNSHDVAIVDVTSFKTIVGQEYSVNVTVTVENQGGFDETFNVIVYHDQLAIPTYEQQNTFHSMGDINEDGYIDDVDLEIMLDAYPSTPLDPNWNPFCDLDNDGRVDQNDLWTLASNYEKDIWRVFGLSPAPIAKQTVVNLQKRTLNVITFAWKTTGVAKGNYTIIAHATPIPPRGGYTIYAHSTPVLDDTYMEGETDIDDNTMVDSKITVTIPGDVEGDFDVDSEDLFMLAPAYNSKLGDPLYNPRCDFDNDGDVDSMDLFILAPNFGKKESWHSENVSCEENGLEFSMTVKEKSIRIGDTVDITLSLKNVSNETIVICFASGQTFDLYLCASDSIVTKWSDDKCFIQIVWNVTLEGEVCYSETLRWNFYIYDPNTGNYTAPPPGTYLLIGRCVGRIDDAPIDLMPLIEIELYF
mgnify:CR=1 FL=1